MRESQEKRAASNCSTNVQRWEWHDRFPPRGYFNIVFPPSPIPREQLNIADFSIFDKIEIEIKQLNTRTALQRSFFISEAAFIEMELQSMNCLESRSGRLSRINEVTKNAEKCEGRTPIPNPRLRNQKRAMSIRETNFGSNELDRAPNMKIQQNL